jgi:hypothetical protein
VAYLLKFILTKRSHEDNECPSILINAGSHGGNFGRNAHSQGNFLLSDLRIIEEMEDLISELVEDKNNKLKLNKMNAR